MPGETQTKTHSVNPRQGERIGRDAAPIDYAHRHFVNLAATIVLLVLAIASIWTMRAFDTYEARQRCINSGRKDCIPIAAPPKGMVQLVR